MSIKVNSLNIMTDEDIAVVSGGNIFKDAGRLCERAVKKGEEEFERFEKRMEKSIRDRVDEAIADFQQGRAEEKMKDHQEQYQI